MKKGEVTLIAFTDFSKAFDTVDYSVIIRKLHNIGFSKQALRWSLSYLTDRQQFVQVNDKQSQFMDVQFGVPQGSILGPVLFNLYVNDMRNSIQDGFNCHQYADDTTIYQHCKPKRLQTYILNMNENMNNLETWAGKCNLLLNEKKTKQMVIATCQKSRAHNLGLSTYTPPIKLKNKCIERVDNFKLLGTWLNENLTWANHINNIIPSCYKTLATLRRIKIMTPQETKKSLAQSLVLSKLHFNDTVTYPLPAFLQKKVQRVQNAAASFVLNRFCSERDVLEVGWLPTLERTQYNIMKLVHKALHKDTWPSSLALIRHNPGQELRSSRATTLQIPLVKGTWQDSAVNLFNGLPETVRSCTNFSAFRKESYRIMQARASERLTKY